MHKECDRLSGYWQWIANMCFVFDWVWNGWQIFVQQDKVWGVMGKGMKNVRWVWFGWVWMAKNGAVSTNEERSHNRPTLLDLASR